MMADPLSVLGAAVGVTSLIIQLADECIKGYKLYHSAANFPQAHRYLLVRLHIEQQRFLNFALQAGVLNEDSIVCSSLQVNRSLLLAILAEIKVVFDKYVASNGKYEKRVAQNPVVQDEFAEQDMELISLLFTTASLAPQAEKEPPASKRAEAAKRVRGVGRSIAQTAQNLRTIVMEPKRLVWAAVDKESFEKLISKLESLNSFLIALLDSSQTQRLQDSMTTTYGEILQLRNDVVDLKALIKALAPAVEVPQNIISGTISVESNALPQRATEETAIQEKQKDYLRRLAEIKIQFSEMSKLSKNAVTASNFGKFMDAPLPLSELGLTNGRLDSENLRQRSQTTYRGRNVWVEWKDTLAGNVGRPNDDQIQWRIGLLADLLRSAKPEGFRAAPCVGYVKTVDVHDTALFGTVFEEPSDQGVRSKITTLRDLYRSEPKPSLSERMAVCATLARCIYSLHAVNWLHKALRADNIIFFSSSDSPSLDAPFVSGFELSRPSIMDQLTEKPGFEPSKEIYRHPCAQSSQTDGNYRKSYDIYSLGIVLIEIALWKPIEGVVGLADIKRPKPSMLQQIQPWLLGKLLTKTTGLPSVPTESQSCMHQLASACGNSFRDVVECCLTMDDMEKRKHSGEQEATVSLRLQRLTERDIVKKLEYIAGAV